LYFFFVLELHAPLKMLHLWALAHAFLYPRGQRVSGLVNLLYKSQYINFSEFVPVFVSATVYMYSVQ
jgi:hypothetical protein